MNINKKAKGFTIIEVVLVLAIAGLIFLMVFIALPALQRSQRDTQRKNDLSRAITALTSYQSNNRGGVPAGFVVVTGSNTTWPSLLTRYIVVNGDTFADPTGANYSFAAGPVGANTYSTTAPRIYVTTGAICNGESLTLNQGARKVALQLPLEGSGIACANN